MRPARRVVICGGGVAAIEALLALREMLAIRPHIDLIAPDRDFVYAPMAVAEPFGLAQVGRFDLAAIAEDLGAELHVGCLAGVNRARKHVTLTDGSRLQYDAAIVAVGARRRQWLAGATAFGGAGETSAFADLLARLEGGGVARLGFASPSGVSWTLPLYELALLTASRLAERGIVEVEITIATPEDEPLAIFGAGAARMLRSQLFDRGIRLRAGATARRFAEGVLELGSGEIIEIDELVTLPQLDGPRIRGLESDEHGFILIDDECRARGARDVYAAGDGTAFPIKQGGIATQQADVAAESIAAGLGAPLQPSVFEPRLRGILLTGVAPMYLRAGLAKGASSDTEVSADALWWPSTKIAGRYLGPYLAFTSTPAASVQLEDRPACTHETDVVQASHSEARELALVLAEADARSGDFRSAISWLEIIERLDGVLPNGVPEMRAAWQAQVNA